MAKEGWPLVGDARREMADLIEGLTPQQLASPSLCGKWNCHQVAAHLLTFTHVGVPSARFMGAMLRSGFNYDKAADRLATELAESHAAADIARMLRDKAEHPNKFSSFPPEMTLTDITIHLQDIRRPLGLDGGPAPNVIDAVLTFMTSHKQAKAVVPKGLADELSFEPTDIDATYGSGPSVQGPGEALIMTLGGRDTHAELTGDGADTLRSRAQS